MQVSEKEGEHEPVWNQAVSCFKNQMLSLIFFGSEPVHDPFGTEHKHIETN